MHYLTITDSDMDKLEDLRYNHPHPKVQKRCQTIWLREKKYKSYEIQDICNISRQTYWRTVDLYRQEGIKGIQNFNYPKHKSTLYEHKTTIKDHLLKNPPATINQAREMILELTGIDRCPTQIRKFLLNCGFKFRKVGVVPSKADVLEQKDFVEKQLQPRIEEASKGKRALFFVDAAHFVMGAFLGFLWTCVRLFVKSSSGRSRFNVLGAIDIINKKLIKITNDSYINLNSRIL